MGINNIIPYKNILLVVCIVLYPNLLILLFITEYIAHVKAAIIARISPLGFNFHSTLPL